MFREDECGGNDVWVRPDGWWAETPPPVHNPHRAATQYSQHCDFAVDFYLDRSRWPDGVKPTIADACRASIEALGKLEHWNINETRCPGYPGALRKAVTRRLKKVDGWTLRKS